MHTVDVAHTIVHLSSDLLPGLKAEVPLLQKNLILGIIHSLDDRHDLALQINKTVDVPVDFFLQADDLAHSICQCGAAGVRYIVS